MRKMILFAALAATALASAALVNPALAQQTYPTAASGVRVQGTVPLQCNASGAACAPVSASNPAGPSQVVGNVASQTADSGAPVKIGGVINGTPVSGASGQRIDLWVNPNGAVQMAAVNAGASDDAGTAVGLVSLHNSGAATVPLGTVSYGWSGTNFVRMRADTAGSWVVPAPSAAATNGLAANAGNAVTSAVVGKASAGNLYGVNVVAGASAGFVLIFNAVSAPADGAVTPVKCIPLAANAGIDLNYRPLPVYFTTGITVVFSTTGCFSKTASATAFISVDAK